MQFVQLFSLRWRSGAAIAFSVFVGVFVPNHARAELPSVPPDGGAGRSAGTVSLRDVLGQAVEGNADLRRARATVESAAARALQSEGQFDFVLSGDGTVSRRKTPPLTPQDVLSGDTRALTLDLALSRALESGGNVSLSAQDVVTRSTLASQCGGVAPCSIYGSNLSLTFTQPLLRGFGSEIALMNIREARIQKDIALLNRQARASLVIRDVVTAYWEWAYAGDDLEIRRAAVRLADEQRKATQAQVDVGRLGAADLAAVDRAIADRSQDVVVAEQSWLNRGLDIERLLGRAVTPDFSSPRTAEHATPLESASVAIDTRAETERALASSPQLKALRAGQSISELEIQRALSLLRPQLDLTGTLSSIGRTKDNFSESWAEVGRMEALNGSIGAAFQWPLQNRAARGAEMAARSAGDSSRIDAEDLELGIRDSVVRLSTAIRTGARRGELARQAVSYAEVNLRAEQSRFEVGRSTNNDVLLRQQELKSAQIQVVRAATDVAIAEAALAAVSGDILDRYQIALRGL